MTHRFCRRRPPQVGYALIAAALLPGVAAAQTATGNVRGYVTAAAGAPVPDAQVIARELTTNARRTTSTNASGFYFLGGLRPGRYEVSVRRIGLAPQTRQVSVGIAETSDLNLSTAEAAVQLSGVRVAAVGTAAQTRARPRSARASRGTRSPTCPTSSATSSIWPSWCPA